MAPRLSCEPTSTSLTPQFKELAKEHGLWLSCGGFHERAKAEGGAEGGAEGEGEEARTSKRARVAMEDKVYNSHVIIRPDGSIASVYRKIHLFDVK